MYKQIGIVFGVLIALIGMGMATSGDIIFSEHIMRPGAGTTTPVYVYDDSATLTGWGEFSHIGMETLGTMNEQSIFTTMPVPQGYAPLETASETVTLGSSKEGTMADPWFYSHIDSDITVGAAGFAGVNGLGTDMFGAGNQYDQVGADRYDTLMYNIVAFYGDSEATLGAQLGDHPDRGIFTLVDSHQDDYLNIVTGSNAGYDTPQLSSYVQVIQPGTPGTSESQLYRQLNFMSLNSWQGDYYNTLTFDSQVVNTPWNLANMPHA